MKLVLRENNSFNRQSHESDSVIIDDNYDSNDSVSSYKIEQLLDKKVTNVRNKIKIEYLVRWYDYESEWNVWYNIKNLQQTFNLIIDYERIFNNVSEKFLSVIKFLKCCDRLFKCHNRFVKFCDKLQEF